MRVIYLWTSANAEVCKAWMCAEQWLKAMEWTEDTGTRADLLVFIQHELSIIEAHPSYLGPLP